MVLISRPDRYSINESTGRTLVVCLMPSKESKDHG